jgi:diguanylate cyclase (GGDEF)-like protein
MSLTPFSFNVVARIAMAVVQSVDLHAAYEVLASELLSILGTRALVFERHDSGWVAVAGTLLDRSARDWESSLTSLPSGTSSLVRLDESGQATAISLTGPQGPAVAIVLDGDWTAVHDSLSTFALVMSFSLHAVRERDRKHDAERRLRSGYAMVRRLSRLGGVDTIAQQIVDHVADLVGADRVSLAFYSAADEALTIAATHGFPRSQVEDVRIKPGSWVIGHVFTTQRPVFVRDVRQLPGMAVHRDQYRTFSFAAVPLLAGAEAMGVLTVTDKRDGSAFDRQDEMTLRAVSVAAALALMAARSDTEAAKLAYAATIDSLTGLLNRPFFDNRLHQEVERTKREGTQLAVLMADIDDFKRINDTLGHQTGDVVLRVAGNAIRSAVRVFDVCARYGGDEFAIVMPNCDQKSALACAERIRSRIADFRGEFGGVALPPMTMSIGVAVMEADEDASDLILRADRCLYQAKADGKNAVRAHSAQLANWPLSPVPRRDHAPAARTDVATLFDTSKDVHLPYVLVADASQERVSLCMEAVRPFQLGFLVARHGTQAIHAIERFGPPVLLIVDLSLPGADGFAVVETLVKKGGRAITEIVAWAASRELREYASSRLRDMNVRVLGTTAPSGTVRSTIERVLQRRGGDAPDGAGDAEPNEIEETMNAIVRRARQIVEAPGVAVYLKEPGETRFRACFKWSSDELMPQSPYFIPRAFNRIRESGETVVLPDLIDVRSGDAPAAAATDPVQGLIGVPIVLGDEIVGVICVFDLKPINVDEASVTALQNLGRRALARTRPETLPASTPVRYGHGIPDVWAQTARPAFRDRAADRRSDGGRQEPALIDFPPSLLERSGGEFAVARELARARREGRQLSVVLFDVAPASAEQSAARREEHIDSVADTLLRTIRQSDLPIRWSVTELLLVLPGLGGREARLVAERVRAALQAGSQHRLAVSGGVAELETEERFTDVVDRARQKVALAVDRGHNRVI